MSLTSCVSSDVVIFKASPGAHRSMYDLPSTDGSWTHAIPDAATWRQSVTLYALSRKIYGTSTGLPAGLLAILIKLNIRHPVKVKKETHIADVGLVFRGESTPSQRRHSHLTGTTRPFVLICWTCSQLRRVPHWQFDLRLIKCEIGSAVPPPKDGICQAVEPAEVRDECEGGGNRSFEHEEQSSISFPALAVHQPQHSWRVQAISRK
ncbi:hypothetical protein MHYP_G00227010 [Metynnis hypsauchen]